MRLSVRRHGWPLLTSLLGLVLLLLLLRVSGGRSEARLLAGRPSRRRALAPAIRLEAAGGRGRRSTHAVVRSRRRRGPERGWLRGGVRGRGPGDTGSGL